MSEIDSVWGGTLLSAAVDFDFELGFELEVGPDSERSDDPTLMTNLNQKNQLQAGEQSACQSVTKKTQMMLILTVDLTHLYNP